MESDTYLRKAVHVVVESAHRFFSRSCCHCHQEVGTWHQGFLFGILEYSNNLNLLFIIMPAIGILLTIIVVRFVLRRDVGHGIPGILYAISRNKGIVKSYNTYASIITSSLTVGFGGSVGLEGPSVSTGASIGSNIGQLLRLNHKQIIVLIGMGAAAALAAIFQAPITGVILPWKYL